MSNKQMVSQFFQGATYRTPEKIKGFFFDKLFLKTRWYFYYKYLRIVFKYRKFAVKEVYTDEIWSKSSHEVFQAMERCGAHFEIEGIDNISKSKEPVVFVANHMSTAEAMLLPAMIAPFRKVTFVVKESLIRDPIFGAVMRSRNPVSVTRKDARKDMVTVLEQGVDRLQNGYSVVIFPEGTRQKFFSAEKFNSLGVKLAAKAGVKVVPIALKTDFWGHGIFFKEWGPLYRKKKLHFNFGEPLEIEKPNKLTHRKVIDFIKENLSRWMLPT